MTYISFESWKKQPGHGELIQKHVVKSEGEQCKWGRIICQWKEKQTDSTIDHTYAAAINLQNGDIYLDCRKRKVWAKCCLYSLIQPIFLTVKTIYHLLLPISIPYEIYKTVSMARKENPEISKKELAQRSFKQVGKNLADIVRTPAYAIALTVIGVAGVIIGPLAPKILYDIRATAGKVEKSLNWGDAESPWIIFPCFQPLDNVMTVHDWQGDQNFDDTLYVKEKNSSDSTLKGLTHFARSQIKFRRRERALFNDCLQKYPADKPYRSRSTPVEA